MTSGLTFPAPAMAVMRVAFKAPQVGLSFGDVYFTTATRSGFDDPNTAAPSDASHTRLIAIRSSHTLFPHAAPNLNGAFFAVPEPASFALLALGAALGFRRR